MISADLGDGVIRWMDGPDLLGPLWEIHEDDHEFTVVTKYEYKGRVVHRGVHVTLKRGIGIEAIPGVFG